MMRWSPLTPHLPRYPGPYNVGTIELELSVPGHLERTFGNCTVKTLLVRLFYPTDVSKGRSPRWVGTDGSITRGYANFLGLPPRLLSSVGLIGLNYTELPAYTDAPLLQPPTAARAPADGAGGDAQKVAGGRWPCMVFSHGLGGTRNAYSQICGSLASGGSVVCAVEHRDNSAAISVVDEAETVEYVSIKETNAETIAKRRNQLNQRAYEYRLAIELVRSLNAEGTTLWQAGDFVGTTSLKQADDSLVSQFAGKLDCLGLRRFVAVGHSFGAATAVHCCKDRQTIISRIAESPLQDEFRAAVLLDPWMQVLEDSRATRLTVPAMAIASEAFHKWTSNWQDVKQLLTPTPPTRYDSSGASNGGISGSSGGSSGVGGVGGDGSDLKSQTVRNRLFHLVGSAHLSQSDFQLLFPTATKFAFKASIAPKLAMELNVRIVRAWLRDSTGIGATDEIDAELFGDKYQGVLVEEPLP